MLFEKDKLWISHLREKKNYKYKYFFALTIALNAFIQRACIVAWL